MITGNLNSIEGLQNLRRLYDQIDAEAASFMAKTALKCPALCGKCCDTPSRNIEATVLEMIPPAVELWEKGGAEAMMDRLVALAPDARCVLFMPLEEPGSGRCKLYRNRGLVCRLFGISGNLDKYQNIRFSLCSRMKCETPDKEAQVREMIEKGLSVPIFSAYRFRISGLNPLLAEELYPINTALHLALQKVGYYLSYK